MEQAGEIQFPCLLFFGSKREKLEGKKPEMNGGSYVAFADAGRGQQC